jgi:hypothetical protein
VTVVGVVIVLTLLWLKLRSVINYTNISL